MFTYDELEVRPNDGKQKEKKTRNNTRLSRSLLRSYHLEYWKKKRQDLKKEEKKKENHAIHVAIAFPPHIPLKKKEKTQTLFDPI